MSSQKSRESVRYYDSYETDFVQSRNQDQTLPPDYVWMHTGISARAAHAVLYFLSKIFAKLYGTLILHMKVVRVVNLRDYRGCGAVVYANHTQPMGDAFTPVWVCSPKKCYIVASPSNFGIPIFGPLLPVMGALPIPSSFHSMRGFLDAVHQRIQEKNCIIIYPEAHVWPYCTEIRPYPVTSFSFPVDCHAPAFCMTSTYQDRRHGRPRTTVFLDGPFYPDSSLPLQAQKQQLHDSILAKMQERSKLSTSQYVVYKPKGTAGSAEE